MAFDPRTSVPIRTLPKMIDAACYNRVSLARLGEPLDVEIPALRMTVRVERRLWTARSLVNDILLMVWADFQVGERGLHEPVPCRMHLYHFHAGLLMGHAPPMLAKVLDEWLGRDRRGHRPPRAVTVLARPNGADPRRGA